METNIPENHKYVIGVDVGSTNLRCYVYTPLAQVKGEAHIKMNVLIPKPGWVETDPEELWQNFVKVVNQAIHDAAVPPEEILGMGISTQRCTVLTWNKNTGKPYHNFIAWNDIRNDSICKRWNKSLRIKALRFFGGILYGITRNKRYLSARVYKLTTPMVVTKLAWIFENIPEVKEESMRGNVLMGTVDTWLLWNLTGGKVHATDASCVCCTGLFDPFIMNWANWAINMFGIPPSILPQVKPTSSIFGESLPELFGTSIPISSLVGDQQASMFGECCFDIGNVKVTMGTGSFININTGNQAHASFKGLYPLVGWVINDQVTYVAEGASNDAGTAIEWAHRLGLFTDPVETMGLANSVPDTEGLCFVPAFHGIQAPLNDNTAAAAFVGLKVTSTKAHLVRAILEAMAFRVKQMYDIIKEEGDFEMNLFRINGGMSQNDFILQMIADLMGCSVERPRHLDMSCLGAAFLAGLAVGVWPNLKTIKALRRVDKTFQPDTQRKEHLVKLMKQWERAIQRCLYWYT